MSKVPTLAIILLLIGLGSLIAVVAYTGSASNSYSGWGWQAQNQQGMMGQWNTQPKTQSSPSISMDEAKTIAQQYLTSTGNQNLAIKEIMEFQYNFYVIYSEKDTGLGAFEMLIWKQTPPAAMMGGGMMGGYVNTGVIVPESGPNMMWNTRYSPMANGMMGYKNQPSPMTISKDKASQTAQAYLTQHFSNAGVEMGIQFYGYYTFDFTVNGKIAGMLSVNGYTGQVWYHSWHGDFIQEVEFG